jgi:hypothetical protein
MCTLGFYFEHSDLTSGKVDTRFPVSGLNYKKQIFKQTNKKYISVALFL